jgi:endonuclease YncB( thermonuclease family)
LIGNRLVGIDRSDPEKNHSMIGCNSQARWPALAELVALLLAGTALGQEAIVSARIVGISDGDTVKALVAGNQLLRVRLSWIDAPEKSLAFGQRSKQHLSDLVFGREVKGDGVRLSPIIGRSLFAFR